MGRRLFSAPVTLLFNEKYVFHRRIVGGMQALDMFGRIHYASSHTTENILLKTHNEQIHSGFQAWLQLGIRIPPLWLLVPFIWFGSLFQKKTPIVSEFPLQGSELPSFAPTSARRVFIVGSFLFVVNTLCGLAMIDTWPVARYPTFATLAQTTVPSVTFGLYGADNELLKEINLFSSAEIRDAFQGERLRVLVERVLSTSDSNLQKTRAKALIETLIQFDPSLAEATRITFFKTRVYIEPGRQGEEVERQELFVVDR